VCVFQLWVPDSVGTETQKLLKTPVRKEKIIWGGPQDVVVIGAERKKRGTGREEGFVRKGGKPKTNCAGGERRGKNQVEGETAGGSEAGPTGVEFPERKKTKKLRKEEDRQKSRGKQVGGCLVKSARETTHSQPAPLTKKRLSKR